METVQTETAVNIFQEERKDMSEKIIVEVFGIKDQSSGGSSSGCGCSRSKNTSMETED